MKKFNEKYKDITYVPYFNDLFIHVQTVEKIKNKDVKDDILNIIGIAQEQYGRMISRSMADKDEERTIRRDRANPGKYKTANAVTPPESSDRPINKKETRDTEDTSSD